MKRDMELIRKILFQLEEVFAPGEGLKFGLQIDGFDSSIIGEHCELIYEAGLVRDFRSTRGGAGNNLLNYTIGPLNNRGHDYLELIRNDHVWKQTNEEVKKKNLPQTIQTIGNVAGSIFGAFMREYNR